MRKCPWLSFSRVQPRAFISCRQNFSKGEKSSAFRPFGTQSMAFLVSSGSLFAPLDSCRWSHLGSLSVCFLELSCRNKAMTLIMEFAHFFWCRLSETLSTKRCPSEIANETNGTGFAFKAAFSSPGECCLTCCRRTTGDAEWEADSASLSSVKQTLGQQTRGKPSMPFP